MEAAAGYGKSVLGAELVEAWGAVPIWVLLEEGSVSARLFVARLQTAVARAGFRDAARALAAAETEDPAGAVDVLLDEIAEESCALVIDDAHHASREAAVLVDRIAGQLAATQHLAVLARILPPGLERLRRADGRFFVAADLALRPEETIELCRSGFGLDVSADDARLLDAATGGWTAAAVLAASRAQRTATSLRSVTAAGGSHSEAMDAILAEAVSAFASEGAWLGQIASLPLLNAKLLAQLTGDRTFFERALATGLPLTHAYGDWWQLPAPVRDRLQRFGHAEPAVLLAAAAHYEHHGELGVALQMLLAAGLADEAAQLLAAADPRTIETVDLSELLAVLDRIPVEVLDRFPLALLHVARACAAAVLLQERSRLLTRLDGKVDARRDPGLRRAVDAELLIDVINGGNPLEAEAAARDILEAAGADEPLTRARALNVLGVAAYFRRDPDGSLPEAVVREAADCLAQATRIYLGLGYRLNAAGLAPHRAIWIELGLGRLPAALEILNDALALASDHPRRFSRILFFRTQVLTELGRFDEVYADLDEVAAIAQLLGDEMMAAYVHWQLMIVASLRGDSDAASTNAQQVEARRGDWWAAASAHFLADAADSLDRVGQAAIATDYLRRAEADPQDAQRLIGMAECALLARHGDPVLAEQRLLEVRGKGILPREYWRVTLLRAYAALRRGETSAGALAAHAFEEAARLGQPQAPLLRERELAESLLALAVATGLPAAQSLSSSSLPVAVAVLGRFEVSRGGRTVELAPGREAQLLKLVAVNGGALLADQAIETLWPEVAPDVGRNRLRTVLSRLRADVGDVVQREGDALAFSPDVRLDLAEFNREAREALALGHDNAAVAIARSAIARYRGELLPHDLYESWADEPRESASRTILNLFDLCARAAAERGDLDEARRMVERTVELAPFDEYRYLGVASILHERGMKGAALSLLRRVRSELAQKGLEPPAELVELEESMAPVTTVNGAPTTPPAHEKDA